MQHTKKNFCLFELVCRSTIIEKQLGLRSLQSNHTWFIFLILSETGRILLVCLQNGKPLFERIKTVFQFSVSQEKHFCDLFVFFSEQLSQKVLCFFVQILLSFDRSLSLLIIFFLFLICKLS